MMIGRGEPRLLLIALAVLPAALSGGCGGAEIREPPPLPFHVAVIPTSVRAEEPSPEAGENGEVLEIRLQLESSRVSRALRQALDGRCFARATLLTYPENAEEFLRREEKARAAYWLERAKGSGADILMASELGYQPTLESGRNDRFWLNLPLFMLGGPFSFFVNDRSYYADVKLDVVLYDLTFELTDLAAGASEVLDQAIRAEFKETSLDLADRAGTDVLSYALSLFVPAGFVSKENERVKQLVEEAVMEGLGEDLLAKIRGETSRLNANRGLCSFCLDLERMEVARRDDGAVRLAVPVRLLFGSRGVSDYEIRAPGMPGVTGAFEDGPDAEDLYWIRETLSAPSDARWLRLRIGDRQGRARAYTLRIDGPGSS